MSEVTPTSGPGGTTSGVVAPDLAAVAPATTQATTSTKSKELEIRAKEYVMREKFNRIFTVPATDAHPELSVTYAVGGVDRDNAPTLLFIGGLMGGRYMALLADYIAEKQGLRVIVTDRPGLGGSTPVEPALRLPVWLETVPVLMRTIKSQNISLAAHSCGVVYALNTIYAMPWILPPSKRKLYLLSPWVPPEHSGMTLLSISSYLPSALINSLDSVMRFANSTIMPTVQFSGLISGALSAPFAKAQRETSTNGKDRFQKHERDDLCLQYRGISAAEVAALSQQVMRRVFGESINGSSHEALLCLRKDGASSWGPCDSYETYGDALEVKLQDDGLGVRRREGVSTGPSAAATSQDESKSQHDFGLSVFWSEKDHMIGKKGGEYFDKCFQRFVRDGNSHDEGKAYLSYGSETIPDTDHDTICLPEYGVLSKMLEDITREQITLP